MAGRFVSAGAIDAASGEAVAAAPAGATGAAAPIAAASAPGAGSPPTGSARRLEWEAVQRELDAERQRRAEERRAAAAAGGGEKSLFEVLQANKAAKEAAVEEANKIKHQFRALDEDEIDFLDTVQAEKRAEEERVRRETEEGLGAFRREQLRREAEAEGGGGEDEWAAVAVGGGGARKRKRREEKGGLLKGVKMKRRESVVEKEDGERNPSLSSAGEASGKGQGVAEAKGLAEEKKAAAMPTQASAAKPKPVLVAYGSDDDSD